MIRYKGGNGSSKEKAIIILGAESELEGVDAEYDYLDQRFNNWELADQSFLSENQKQYDIISIVLPDDSKKEIWFDITNFYGREDE